MKTQPTYTRGASAAYAFYKVAAPWLPRMHAPSRPFTSLPALKPGNLGHPGALPRTSPTITPAPATPVAPVRPNPNFQRIVNPDADVIHGQMGRVPSQAERSQIWAQNSQFDAGAMAKQQLAQHAAHPQGPTMTPAQQQAGTRTSPVVHPGANPEGSTGRTQVPPGSAGNYHVPANGGTVNQRAPAAPAAPQVPDSDKTNPGINPNSVKGAPNAAPPGAHPGSVGPVPAAPFTGGPRAPAAPTVGAPAPAAPPAAPPAGDHTQVTPTPEKGFLGRAMDAARGRAQQFKQDHGRTYVGKGPVMDMQQVAQAAPGVAADRRIGVQPNPVPEAPPSKNPRYVTPAEKAQMSPEQKKQLGADRQQQRDANRAATGSPNQAAAPAAQAPAAPAGQPPAQGPATPTTDAALSSLTQHLSNMFGIDPSHITNALGGGQQAPTVPAQAAAPAAPAAPAAGGPSLFNHPAWNNPLAQMAVMSAMGPLVQKGIDMFSGGGQQQPGYY